MFTFTKVDHVAKLYTSLNYKKNNITSINVINNDIFNVHWINIQKQKVENHHFNLPS